MANFEVIAFYREHPKSIGGVKEEIPALTAEEEKLISEIASIELESSEATSSAVEFTPRDNPFQ